MENNDVVKLKDFKQIKKLKRYINDITKIMHIMSTSQKALSFFKQYSVTQETISVMETNKTFLELYLKKYEKELAEITGEHPEKSTDQPKV
jgi:hypothetical protein